MSIDTHKYGCCPKGSSVLIFRDLDYFENCYFIQSEWSGGIYATTNLTGSRSGLNLALTWAMMAYNGKEGYRDNAKQIYKGLARIKTAFSNDHDIYVFGDPLICVVGFGSDTIDIYKVSDRMKKMGWNLNELQNPPSFHLCITNCHNRVNITLFIEDLKSCLDKVVNAKFNKNYITTNLEYSELSTIAENGVSNEGVNNNLDIDGRNVSFDEDNDNEEKTGASVYGTTQKVPDQSIVDEVVKCYLNSIH
jgi:sphinganine-1-phosphate aldolase